MVRTFEPTNIHSAKLIDLPLMRRLTETGVLLDSELVCTREALGTTDMLSGILPQRGVFTLVGRAGRQKVIGQFRLRADVPLAQMIFVAPEPDSPDASTAMLHLLDGVAIEAGKRGAHMLMAEVDEDSALFETMRRANFAVYSRQTLWRWMGDPDALPESDTVLDEITSADDEAIASIFSAIVPTLIQPIALPSEEAGGWLYRRAGWGERRRVSAHIAYASGRSGGFIMPYVAHDVVGAEAESLFRAALVRAKADKQAVFVCLRRHQEWLDTALAAVGFVPFREQAVMVRHIAAGVRHAQFALNGIALSAIPGAVRPPNRSSLRLGAGVMGCSGDFRYIVQESV